MPASFMDLLSGECRKCHPRFAPDTSCSSCIFLSCLELKVLQSRKIIPSPVKTLTVEDPSNNIGSGAATLNALLVVTEFLSAEHGFTVSSELLDDKVVVKCENKLHSGH